MKRTTTAFIILAIFCSLSASAQKRKSVTKKKVAVKTEKKAVEDPKIVQMLSATQKIIFIDSIVVNKNDFLNRIKLNPETGTLAKSVDFFGINKGDKEGTVYENELGNKCYFSFNAHLYTSDLLNGEWSKAVMLDGIASDGSDNYPFMMTDGTTFYFASTNSEGLGGYDIYMTRFDAESGRFLKPENIGMPFNSEANDYMYAIDEIDSIGYFVTDRRQPEGKVCVYTFIPNQTRRTYDPDDYDDATIRSLARIDRIKDTWGNGTQRKRAMVRVKRLANMRKQKSADEILFHINDDITYNSINEFLLPDNMDKYLELQEKIKYIESLGKHLEQQRQEYATASSAERDLMEADLQRSENEYYEQQLVIKQLEKTIRNTELQLLK